MRQLRNTILFVALLVASIFLLERLFILGPFTSEERISGDNRASFESLEPNTLDMVYVGASNVYAFWMAPIAWDATGLASHSYTNSSMPSATIRYSIQKCRETQPNALYVVNVNNFRTEGRASITHCHWVCDRMPLSPEKVAVVQTLCQQNGFTPEQGFELLFPLQRFHSTWNQLRKSDFVTRHAEVGGAGTNAGLFITNDVTADFNRFVQYKKAGVSEDLERTFVYRHDSLDDLISYCKREKISILFVNLPQAITSERDYLQVSRCIDQIRREGMDFVDLSDPATVGLNTKTDYANALHTNAHGAIRFTNYLARYILSQYDIKDRRGQSSYESWNKTAADYKTFLESRIVRDFEYALPKYDYGLAVSGLTSTNLHLAVKLTWDARDDVSEYLVYRQLAKSSEPELLAGVDDLSPYTWKKIATLPADQTSYIDTGVRDEIDIATQMGISPQSPFEKLRYDYSVIPVLRRPDGDVYGSYFTARSTIELRRAKEARTSS